MRRFVIVFLIVFCGCTNQQEIEEQKRQEQQRQAEEQKRVEEQRKAEEERKAQEELTEEEKEFARDVQWILGHTLNNGYNPGAKKLKPNAEKEENSEEQPQEEK